MNKIVIVSNPLDFKYSALLAVAAKGLLPVTVCCVLCERVSRVVVGGRRDTRPRHGELLRHLQRPEGCLGRGHRPGMYSYK